MWVGETDITASDLLKAEEDEETKTAVEEAKEFLKEILSSGAVASSEIKKDARKAGISEITLNRAKRKLGIKTKFLKNEKGKIVNWIWELPDDHPGDHPLNTINDHLDKSFKTRMNTKSYPDGQQKKFGHLERNKAYQGISRSKPDDHTGYSREDDNVGHLDEKEGSKPKKNFPGRGDICL